MSAEARSGLRSIEWPTIVLIAGCYGLFALASTALAQVSLPLAVVLVGLTAALHSSLTHEAVHGHPTRSPWLNATLVFPSISLTVPYERFRDLHLAHHTDSTLTDPYDDPESNYFDPAVWNTLSPWQRAVLRFNNTLLGRVTLGPALGTGVFVLDELRAAVRGDPKVLRAWLLHIPAAALIIAWYMAVGTMPLWAVLVATYLGMSIIRIRTFLEHQAHEKARARTVIIEDRGPLAFLFLNNNFHVVHHMHPKVPWYHLPQVYAQGRDRYVAANEGYVFKSYGEIFRRYFLRRKDPVPHPLWPTR